MSLVGLGRGQQMQCQHPGAQRQFGGREHGATEQRGLVPTTPALVVNLRAAAKARTPAFVATRASKATRQERRVQRALTLGFGPVQLRELRHRKTLLELHQIDRPDTHPRCGNGVIVRYRRGKSCDRRLRNGANQVRGRYEPYVPGCAGCGPDSCRRARGQRQHLDLSVARAARQSGDAFPRDQHICRQGHHRVSQRLLRRRRPLDGYSAQIRTTHQLNRAVVEFRRKEPSAGDAA